MIDRWAGDMRASADCDTAQPQRLLAAELRASAARARLAQSTIAEASGFSLSTISRLLNGSRSIDTIQLFQITWALGTTPGQIVRAAWSRYVENTPTVSNQ